MGSRVSKSRTFQNAAQLRQPSVLEHKVPKPDNSYQLFLEKAVRKSNIRSVDVKDESKSHRSLDRLTHKGEWERKYNEELESLSPTRSFVESTSKSKLSKDAPTPKLDLHLNTASFVNPNSMTQIVQEYPRLVDKTISEYDFCKKFKISSEFLRKNLKPVLEIIQLPQLKVNPPDEKMIQEFSHDFKLKDIDPQSISERTSPSHERLHREIRKTF